MNKLLLTLAITVALQGCTGVVDDYGTQEEVAESQQDIHTETPSDEVPQDTQGQADPIQEQPVSQPTPVPVPGSEEVETDDGPAPSQPTPQPQDTPVADPDPVVEQDSQNQASSKPSFPYFESWTHLNNRLDLEGGREVGCYNASMTYSSWTSHGFSFTWPVDAYDEGYYSQRVQDWIDHVGDSNWRYTNIITVMCSVDIPDYADPVVRRDNTQRIDGAESALYRLDDLDGWVLYIHEDLPLNEQQYAYSWAQWAIHKQTTSEYNWNQSYAKQLWCETWGEC